jgi:arylsulfatase A-like enzyme
MIVLWGDHGWHLGEKQHWRKFALWEEATRAPLIWVVPGVTKPGGVCDRTVDFMSLYPTLAELAGIPVPQHVEGRSLRPLLADPQAAWEFPARRRSASRITRCELAGDTFATPTAARLYDEARDPFEWTNWWPMRSCRSQTGLTLAAEEQRSGDGPAAKQATDD